MRTSLLALATIMLVAGLSANAQNTGSVRYKWQDDQGLMHFSDSLTPEAMKYGYDLVNDQGMVVQRVPRQLNAQERAAANKLAAEKAAKQRALQEQANADAQMLAAYPDEESYRILQQQQLETIDQQISTTRINLRSQEKSLTELLARAADIEADDKPVPKFLADNISEQRNVVANQRNVLKRQQDLRAQTVANQKPLLERYRQLRKAADGEPPTD